MIYEYRCNRCKESVDVIKPVSQLEKVEYCNRGHRMSRVFCFRGQVSFGSFKPGYYPSFGKTFTDAHQLKNEIRRINGEEGRTIVEVGNDRDAMRKLKPPKKKPNIEGALHEMKTKQVDFNA